MEAWTACENRQRERFNSGSITVSRELRYFYEH